MQKNILLIGAVIVIVVIGVAVVTGIFNKPAELAQTDQNQQYEITAATVTWCITDAAEVETCFDPIEFDEADNAFDTFSSLNEREDSLSFEATDYGPELGQFVTKINGVEGTAAAFWKLYVNGTGSEIGISQVKPADLDSYEFIYEAVQN